MNKKQKIYNYIIILFLIIYNFVYQFVILKLFKNEETIITSVFFMVIFIASIIMFGFAKAKLNPSKGRVTKRVVIIVILAIALTYCVGAFVGFLRNGYSLSPINIIKNTYAPLLILVFTELFRYNIIRANKNNFKMVVILTILLIILEMQINTAVVTHWGLREIFILTTTLIIPIIAKNMILSKKY